MSPTTPTPTPAPARSGRRLGRSRSRRGHRGAVLAFSGVAIFGLSGLAANGPLVAGGRHAPSVAASSGPASSGGVPGGATAAVHPFGKLSCAPKYGIRLCVGGLGSSGDLRIPSFDGVPLDADLALPATGAGPFPLIVMLHGLGGSKSNWESTTNDGRIDDVTFASRGYAVLMYTARGFGNSCGTPASRAGTPACAKGWEHLADQRYEVRDTQYLAGELVDEGIAKPAIAVTGVSYGAGQALELAVLKNRERLGDGRLVAWTSPKRHLAMSVAAVYAVWPWFDLADSLAPNGGMLTTGTVSAHGEVAPTGVLKQSWTTLLYGVSNAFYLSPPGVDPQADLTSWQDAFERGEPYGSLAAYAVGQLQKYHSAIGVPLPSGAMPAIAIQSGWTDTLFPVSQALRFANWLHQNQKHSPLLMIFDDVGHGWAKSAPADVAFNTAKGIAFLNSVMLSRGTTETGVVALGQTCPASAPSGSPQVAASFGALVRHRPTIVFSPHQTVTSSGGSAAVAAALNPAYSSDRLCDSLPAAHEPGTASYVLEVARRGAIRLMGAVQIHARLHVEGRFPELVARVWDEAPGGATRQLVALGVLRPATSQGAATPLTASGTVSSVFETFPNDYLLAPGHRLVLELVGRSSPMFRPSNGVFSITVERLEAVVPLV